MVGLPSLDQQWLLFNEADTTMHDKENLTKSRATVVSNCACAQPVSPWLGQVSNQMAACPVCPSGAP